MDDWAVTGRVTTKVDLYSFGVILMELITGRKAINYSQPEESLHLVSWFRRVYLNKDAFQKAIDPTIDLDEESLASINTVAELAGHCTWREPYQRPDSFTFFSCSALETDWTLKFTQSNKKKILYINNNNKKICKYIKFIIVLWFSYQIFIYNYSKKINNNL